MINDAYLKFKVNVKPDLCYKVKGMALERLRGSYESHYSKLRSYMLEMQSADTDGTFKLNTWLDVHEQPVFQKAYNGFSLHTKTESVNNNICETFNSYIVKSRDKPIIELLEDIRKQLITRMYRGFISWYEKEVR